MTARLAVRPLALSVSVIALWGGHAAWESTAKTVAVSVDGHVQNVRTHGTSVRDALEAAHLSVGSHDLLAPAPEVKLGEHTTIVVRHGRLMSLTVDGKARQVWVTAMSVHEALQQIGLRVDGAVLSADRSRAIPLKGFSLEVRTHKGIQLLDGGKVRRIGTNGLVVADLLREQHVVLRPADQLTPAATAPLRDGQIVRVTRVDGRRLVDTVPIRYDVVRRADSSMYRGDTRVVRSGRVGTLRRTFALRVVNGKVASKRLTSSVRVSAPVAKIVAYGTKHRKYSVAGADNLNWYRLAQCESGNNLRSTGGNGRYRGLYQFTLSTWHGVGGKGDPIDWGRGEQTYRAKLLYMRRGSSPWPTCGKYLYS
ncbi:MAG TPA: ubiquitin-like domain-containing protein [Mycobacteriales bacterium]|nr:ubiquitin-like domain-containing protein [Mycobacteriales bacterium]